MKGPELLKKYEDNWETDVGCWFPGERVVVRGEDLFQSCQNTSWMEYLLYIVTGRKDAKLAKLLESVWVFCTSYPDPRLWNNRVAALSGTTKSTGVLAVAAGVAVSEASLYGLRPIKRACDFLIRVKSGLDEGKSLEELLDYEISTYRTAYGYGRPLTSCDERIAPMVKKAREMGFGSGLYLKLVFEIEEKLEKKYKMKMNIAAVYGALMVDQGLTPSEAYSMTTLSFTAGMFASYSDTLDKPSGAFFPLRVSRLNYEGREDHRVWGQ